MANHVSIKSMIKTDDKGPSLCQLFGYSSKSLPQIEIVGLGKRGKILKEKIVYWLKNRNIRLASRRYVICLETFERLNFDDQESVLWLELPVMLLLLVLSDIVVLHEVDKCFCVGFLDLKGKICYPNEDHNYSQVLNNLKCESNSVVLIGNGQVQKLIPSIDQKFVINFEDLLGSKYAHKL